MRRYPWLTAAIVLLVLLGIVHFCLEWRAEQRWQRYAEEARARGVKLMLTEFARPEIPDAQNFAMLPMMQKAFRDDAGRLGFELPFLTRDGLFIWLDEETIAPIIGTPTRGQGPKWEEIAKALRNPKHGPDFPGDPARDALAAMELYAADHRQWNEWRQRPQCRFPNETYLVLLYSHPALKTFSNAAHFFALRAHAHLAVGDVPAAAADLQEGLQAYHELREERQLAVGCYRMAILRVMIDVIGDGLRRRAWNEQQLIAIQAEIESVRVWDDYRFALASERAAVNTRLEALANGSMRDRERIQQHYRLFPIAPVGAFIAKAIPRRFLRDVQLQQNRYFDELQARVDEGKPDIDFNGATPSSPQANPQPLGSLVWYASCLDQTDVTRIERSFAAQQVLLDQARIVCALERYRLAQGAYPATLAELVPQFITGLPRDPYARAPYHYQRGEDDTFLLYGVGANRQDDGGQINPNALEREQLDAIWLYALPAAP